MDCNCLQKKVARIPRGNDFKFILKLMESIVVSYQELQEQEIDGTVSDVTVKLYNSAGTDTIITQGTAANGSNTWSLGENNTIMICFYDALPVGKYGLEVTFKVDGLDRRFYAPPGHGFYIVESSPEGYIPSDTVMTYQVWANLGLGTLVDLSGYYTKLQADALLGNKVDKETGKGLSANDFTNAYKAALDEMIANGSAFSTGEKVGETGITDEATENSDDLITSGGVYAMMNAISSGVKVSLFLNPSVVYKGVATNVTLTGTMSNATASSLQIKDGDSVLKSASNVASTSHTLSVTISADKTYTLVGTYLGMAFTATAKISARYPIYCGMGASASAVAVDGNKLSARTSAAETFTKTATANGQHFYILVPSDISELSNFSMGGAPFAMTSTTTTINGISYKVYESGATYNSGTQVNVTAS